MFERVVVPLDGSEWSEQALGYAAEIVAKFDGTLILLRAYDGPDRAARMLALATTTQPAGLASPAAIEVVTEAAREQQTEARDYLTALAQRLMARGLRVDALVVDGDPAQAILDEAQREPNTVVVMTTHGRGGLGRLVFGSVAQDVITRCHAPVLLIRGSESAPSETGHDTGRDITIGAAVIGAGGRLGDVSRVVVDENQHHVTNVVVKSSRLFGHERVVPIGRVARIEGGVVYLDMDERDFEAMDEFDPERYRGPEDGGTGPRGSRTAASPRTVDLVEGTAAARPGVQQTVLREGMAVRDMTGDKVGDVGDLSVDATTGAPTRITLRRGAIFKHDIEIPPAWVQSVDDEGVVLNVPKARLEQLDQGE